jgi:hypothetical protein
VKDGDFELLVTLISCTVFVKACGDGQRKSNVLPEYLKRDTFWCTVQGLLELTLFGDWL